MITSILLIFLISFLITSGITPGIISIALKFKLVDDPKTRPHPAHTHKSVIPRAGGLPIFFGIFFPFLFLFPIPKEIVGIFLGSVILVLVGLWDDRKDRSPYLRFLTNCLSAIIAIGFGVGIPYITNPFGGIIHLDLWRIPFNLWGGHSILVLADMIGFFWILWTTNIIGWSGGVDGQLPGIVSIAAAVIGFLSLRYATHDPRQLYVTFLSFATAGSFLGFLLWNFYPQKIMPGYGGKTLAGFMLAILSILSFSKLGAALLVLAVPMVDASFILLKRIFRGRSPMQATSGHLHHHLLSLGWGRRRIAFFYWLISAIAGIIALLTNSRQKLFAVLFVVIIACMFIIWINFLRKLPKKSAEEF
ncbi:undecaprenyl/decaprenyl-phosphate alpha-N-acetylglucosaminyl 1-phosphate transferase [Candidatus Gottesmanbacteria bacterium]|nr:undecaprenyl/decaprenyl-phosphate alpha-N-acetylglucosaminyl 1-phosphate transferase [Candidatus Gottesmanbacteria bacterium]